MPTPAQVKARISIVGTTATYYLDNIFAPTTNIIDVGINLVNKQIVFVVDANTKVQALAWATTIRTNLTAASKVFTESPLGRRATDAGGVFNFDIPIDFVNIVIQNFPNQ